MRKGTTNELMIPIHPALARALKAGPVVGMQNLITDARGRPLRGLTELIDRAVRAAASPALRGAWIAQGCATASRGARGNSQGNCCGIGTSLLVGDRALHTASRSGPSCTIRSCKITR